MNRYKKHNSILNAAYNLSLRNTSHKKVPFGCENRVDEMRDENYTKNPNFARNKGFLMKLENKVDQIVEDKSKEYLKNMLVNQYKNYTN